MTEYPLSNMRLADYARLLRERKTTVRQTVDAYLERIIALNPTLNAFVDIYVDEARQAASAIDGMFSAGIDLGPLMGMPIAVKDIFAVSGTRTRAGSNLDVADRIGIEGPFIAGLRKAGCVIIGKTHTTEFAFSPSGINRSTRTPRNPHDPDEVRIPGGSSSGSAVAQSAGMCAFSIGSDTGGSVRVPAALNGVVGLKTTCGLWPLDGVFSLSTTLDLIGIFATSAVDAAYVYEALESVSISELPPADLRIGIPAQHFFDNLDNSVAAGFENAVKILASSGIRFDQIDLPEAAERAPASSRIMASELLSSIGREALLGQLDRVDGAVGTRIRDNSTLLADEYVSVLRRHRQLTAMIESRIAHCHAWISPTSPCEAPALAHLESVESQLRMNMRLTQNSQPINIFGQCAISIPIPTSRGMPIGLQVAGAPGNDRKVLEIALTLERLLGFQEPPRLESFLA